MESRNVDLAVIGAGPGGYVAAIRAASLGRSVVVVERDRPGGVCLNVGCIPTKALITTARAVEAADKGARLGLALEGRIAVDQGVAVARARSVSQRMSKGVQHLLKSRSIEVVPGVGRLEAPGVVQVIDGIRIEAGSVILASGARPRPLPTVPFDGRRVISSTEALALEHVPPRLVVVGAGAIGMEFAYYYSVAGSEVTVVEALDSILPFADPEAVKAVARAMRRRRVQMIPGAKVLDAREVDGDLEIRIDVQGEERALQADTMLVAIGVTPNVQDLWDPSLSMEMDGPFVRTDEVGLTSLPGVYAIGDLAGPPLLAHAASHEGIVAAEHLCGLDPRGKHEAVCPGVVYCQPQVAQVGMSEQQAIDAGTDVEVGRFPFLASGMAQAAGESEGFVKLVFAAGAGPLLGGVIVGAEASELIGELALALSAGSSAREILSTVHPHPSYSEAVMEAAAQAAGEAIHC